MLASWCACPVCLIANLCYVLFLFYCFFFDPRTSYLFRVCEPAFETCFLCHKTLMRRFDECFIHETGYLAFVIYLLLHLPIPPRLGTFPTLGLRLLACWVYIRPRSPRVLCSTDTNLLPSHILISFIRISEISVQLKMPKTPTRYSFRFCDIMFRFVSDARIYLVHRRKRRRMVYLSSCYRVSHVVLLR